MSPEPRSSRTDRGQQVLLFAAMGIAVAFAVSALVGLFDGRDGYGPGTLDPTGTTIRVEVLNGAGVSGLARNATDILRDRGFDVVFYGNDDSFDRDSSAVLARTADGAAAAAVARALGITTVRLEPDSTLVLDVTVLLGADWPPESRERGGWLRRILP